MGERYAAARAQQAFWTTSTLRPGSSMGNECLLLRLKGNLDVRRLASALDHLEERHDAWRTCYALEEGELLADVQAAQGNVLEVVDATAPETTDREQRLLELVESRVLAPFDFEIPRFLRATLFRLAPQDHALLLVSHHVAMDGTSLFALLPTELAEAYETGAAPRGGTLAAPYRRWAEAEVTATGSSADQDFWRRHLAGTPLVLDLPTDHPRPPERRMTGERIRREIGSRGRARLQRAAERLEVGLYDLLLGSLAILLHRYTGQDGFLLGTVHANRREADRRDVFGCLMQTLPLRFDFQGNPKVETFLRDLHAERREAFQRRGAFVDDYLSEIAPADPSRNPGYQVLFNYMPFSEEHTRFADLEVEAWRPDPRWTLTDMSFDVVDAGTKLACVLDRDVALFDGRTAEALLDAWLTAIDALPDALEGTVGGLPLVRGEAREALLAAGRGESIPAPTETLDALVARQVRETPDAVALAHTHAHGETRIRYRELWARSETLAARIAPHLEAAETPYVLLLLEDPTEAIIAMVATLRAGGAYVPVDPSQPANRLARMIEDAPPAVAIVDEARTFEGAPRLSPRGGADRPFEAPSISPEMPCYVIFTSGSTGRPKGVIARHRNVVHQIDARAHYYGSTPGLTLSTYSFAFDAAVACLYWVLTTGGTLVLTDGEDRADPWHVRRTVEDQAIQTLDVPPALYAELLSAGTEGLASLETVILGGDAMAPATARMHRETLPNVRLVNEYGPTETTVFSTAEEIGDQTPVPIPIGRPIRRTQCAVVDRYDQLVPRGGFGELVIGGEGVAAGYANRPGLTSERFVPAKWQTLSPLAYRTGDRVRMDEAERIVFYGRFDKQVQIRGYRVELGEVEAALCRLEGIQQAVVVAQGEKDLQLDAYVVACEDAPATVEAWHRALRDELPAPLIPATLTLIDRIPRSSSGKVDGTRLPEPARSLSPASNAWRLSPHSQTEQMLFDIMRLVLGSETLGVEDDFFQSGGNSLLAVRFLVALEKASGLNVSLRTFVANPTVARLAEALHREELLDEEPLVVVLKEGDGRPPFWIMHPVGGHVVFANQMADHWNPGHALYGIQAPGLDGRRPPIDSMQAAAALYLELIKEKQPDGPYFLGGPSLGGLIAYEIAQQMRKQGETVGMLALLDCYGPGFPARAGRVRRAFDFGRRIARLGPKDGWRYVRTRIESRQGRDEADWLKYDFADDGDEGSAFDTIRRVQSACERMADQYQPAAYPGRLHMFRALNTPDSPGYRFDDPNRGWAPLAGEGVQVIDVVGSHHSMLDEPEVSDLSRKLEDAFESRLVDLGLPPR